MASNVSKGSYYKARTKKWLEGKGYQVAHLEKMHFIFTPKGRIATKKDQFGSDLLAMNHRELVFVQVKFGSPDEPKTLAKFREFPFPHGGCIKIWLVVWKLRAREPQVIDLTDRVVTTS